MATVSVARPLKSRMHPMRNLSVVPTCRTHSRLPRRTNHNQPLAHPASMKGRFGRPSRRVGRGCDGRGWHDRRAWRTLTAKSRGPDLPTLGSSLPVMNGRRRWLSSPDTGEHGAALTPSCRECRLIRLDLWSLPPAFFVCRRAMGEAISRHSRRLFNLRGQITCITRARARRGLAQMCLRSARYSRRRCERSDMSAAARRAKAEAIHLSPWRGHGLLRRFSAKLLRNFVASSSQ
jgi:hypothetical protein